MATVPMISMALSNKTDFAFGNLICMRFTHELQNVINSIRTDSSLLNSVLPFARIAWSQVKRLVAHCDSGEEMQV